MALLRAAPRQHHALRAEPRQQRRAGRIADAGGIGEALEQSRRAEPHAAARRVEVDARRSRAFVGPRDDRAVVVGDQRCDARRASDGGQTLGRLRMSGGRAVDGRNVARVERTVLCPRDDRIGAEVEADRRRFDSAAVAGERDRRRERVREVALDLQLKAGVPGAAGGRRGGCQVAEIAGCERAALRHAGERAERRERSAGGPLHERAAAARAVRAGDRQFTVRCRRDRERRVQHQALSARGLRVVRRRGHVACADRRDERAGAARAVAAGAPDDRAASRRLRRLIAREHRVRRACRRAGAERRRFAPRPREGRRRARRECRGECREDDPLQRSGRAR